MIVIGDWIVTAIVFLLIGNKHFDHLAKLTYFVQVDTN